MWYTEIFVVMYISSKNILKACITCTHVFPNLYDIFQMSVFVCAPQKKVIQDWNFQESNDTFIY